MLPRVRHRLIVAAVIAALVVVSAAIVVHVSRDSDRPASTGPQPTTRSLTIPVNGVKLAAQVTAPARARRPPLLVMPTAWGAAANMYRRLATRFASAGYEVLAYAPRGFGGSTGKIDFAGEQTQRDATRVITWALSHTHADPARVGMMGMSYGAGISLLTAARDKRVRAVVATSTWVTFDQAFDQNGTPSVGALALLLGRSRTPFLDPTVRELQDKLLRARQEVPATLQAMSPVRSPSTYVAELNRNRPAIMLANAYEDWIFSPADLVPFFNSLSTPKRLELAPGDHGSPERPALTGGKSPTVDDAAKWLDHYLRGADNGIADEPPVLLRDIGDRSAHAFGRWPAMNHRVELGPPNQPISDAASSAWRTTLRSATDSSATTGYPQFGTASNYRVPSLPIAAVDPRRALVWNLPALRNDEVIAGTPSLRLRLASSSTTATVFAYLYAVSPAGQAELIDMAPFGAVALRPWVERAVQIPFQPTSYRVRAGDHLALVIDASDPRYLPLEPRGTTIIVSAGEQAPASLTLPVQK